MLFDPGTLLLLWVVCGIATAYFAQNKGAANPVGWFVLGLFLGPIGVAAALMWRPPEDESRYD